QAGAGCRVEWGPLGTKETCADGPGPAPVELPLVGAESRDAAAVEALALDGAALEHVPLRGLELVEPSGEQSLDRRRNGNGVPVVRAAEERQHLLDEERIAAGSTADTALQRIFQ